MEINDYIRANWVFFKQIYNDETVLNAVKEEIFGETKKLLKYADLLLEGKWSKF